ncbi:DUF1298 domain-containing protein [Rhodococcus sp. Eu-32]|uniref:wax ester/triacylglycerol synthase domain-containing protein n=1 Tax=Rhodococcus sp. Eu-32 TaxID=1017319 RepID=UPI000DF314EF|nr:wax ester/triacylglycerol synthase domain-containing protein [Rhodococcus sp. Eu-32]RRQ27921.1 DUF1298 domain-containing protein [Rhodococcus sp. Eu-32]
MAKLDIKDAAFHFLRAVSGPTDMYGIYVFDAEDALPPTFEAIEAHVVARRPVVPALNIVLREAPLGLDFPSWVPSAGDTAGHLSDHDLTGASWPECQTRISSILEVGLDARVRAWHLHVLRGVRDVPTVDGAATVVVLQVSHAMTDGLGLTRIASALFAPPGTPHDVVGAALPGHAPVRRPRAPILAATASILATPIRLARYGIRIRSARKRYAASRSQLAPPVRPGPSTRLTVDPTGSRAVHIVPLPASALRGRGVPVTAVALAAVASATEKYLRAHGDDIPDVLNASVPVSLGPDIEWSSANRALSCMVDLHLGESDPSKRARLIAELVVAERRRVTSPELLDIARAEELLPAPVVLAAQRLRQRRKTVRPTKFWTHTNVVSVDRGRTRPMLELCGSRVTFTSGTPMLAENRPLVHGFFGGGDIITVVVLACPDVVPDHEKYVESLIDSIREL